MISAYGSQYTTWRERANQPGQWANVPCEQAPGRDSKFVTQGSLAFNLSCFWLKVKQRVQS